MQRNGRRTEADLLKEMRQRAALKRGLTAMAEEYGFTVQFIWDIVNGKRGITQNLAERMGYRRIVEFERKSRREA